MQAADWLPDAALVAPAVLATLDARIEEWSSRWFGDRTVSRLDRAGTGGAVALRPAPRHGWRRFGPGMWIDWGEQTPGSLALQALGGGDRHPKGSAGDAELLELLGERIARDLTASLIKQAARLPGEAAAGPDRAVTLTLTSKSQALSVAIALDAGTLAAARKQQCGPYVPPKAEFQPLSRPLGEVPVAFDVALGSARLGLLEFEAVEPGDTIVLDQRIDAPLALRSTAIGTTIAQAKLVREDGRLMLTAS